MASTPTMRPAAAQGTPSMASAVGLYGWGSFDEVEASVAPATFDEVEADYAAFTADAAEARLAAIKKTATMRGA